MEDFRDQYVIEGIPAAEYYDSEEGSPIKYLGTNGQGQIIMLGEGRLGDDNKAIEFLACLSKDNQVEHTTVAPNGGADFTPFDGPYFDVDENEYRIVALPNNPTKLFRQFKTANHQFSFYDITPDCQAINPTTIPLDTDEHLKFTVQPLGNQPEFLFIYSLRLHDSIVQHVAKIGPENKIIWDKVIKIPENQGNKFYTNMDVLVDAAGKKALIVFSNLSRLNESSMIRPLFYEMVLE